MSQGYEEYDTPTVTAGPVIDVDDMAEVETPQADVTHNVAGQHQAAADTELPALPADESSDETSNKGKKTANGETEEFEIASEEEKEEIDLKVKRTAMLTAQKELEEAESKALARKDKEKAKKDHAEAQSSGGGVAAPATHPAELPPGMYLPKARAKVDDPKDMQETMMQLMAHVHNLSKDLKDMQDKIRERDDTIEKLNAGSSPTGFQREFGKGAPQPVDRKITERPKKYTGNFHVFVPWQEKL